MASHIDPDTKKEKEQRVYRTENVVDEGLAHGKKSDDDLIVRSTGGKHSVQRNVPVKLIVTLVDDGNRGGVRGGGERERAEHEEAQKTTNKEKKKAETNTNKVQGRGEWKRSQRNSLRLSIGQSIDELSATR